MKIIYKFSLIVLIAALFLSSCSGSKYGGASHNRGVNTRGFSGY